MPREMQLIKGASQLSQSCAFRHACAVKHNTSEYEIYL